MKSFIVGLFLAGISCAPGLGFAQSPGECPDHLGGYGPYDYTNAVHRAQNLPVVERVHFTPEVENLSRGATGSVGGDLDYTIRAFPNHHRALDALSKLSLKMKTVRPAGLHCSVEGYFERAIRFNDKDATLHMVYGLHFYRLKKIDRAKEQFEAAERLASDDDTNIAYNLGLIYADLQEWDKASRYAQRAYGAGFSLPGLKNRLMKAGKWQEPKPVIPKPAEVVTKTGNDDAKSNEVAPEPGKSVETVPSEVKQ